MKARIQRERTISMSSCTREERKIFNVLNPVRGVFLLYTLWVNDALQKLFADQTKTKTNKQQQQQQQQKATTTIKSPNKLCIYIYNNYI